MFVQLQGGCLESLEPARQRGPGRTFPICNSDFREFVSNREAAQHWKTHIQIKHEYLLMINVAKYF